MLRNTRSALLLTTSAVALVVASHAEHIVESPRRIPVAYDVDVVVVGGTSAGVTAAAEAARAGATVFLAAPRTYLGEDMCATYRLWLEPDEIPRSELARSIFVDPLLQRGYPFTYEADQPSQDKHIDTSPPSMLADGQWANAFQYSVQYNADTTVTLDLDERRQFNGLRFMLFQSPGRFEVAGIAVSVSDDRQTWRRETVVSNTRLGEGSFVESAFALHAELDATARYVRCRFEKSPGAERMLIGEIMVVPDPGALDQRQGRAMATPMQVKHALDRTLLESGVSFLYNSYATDVLRDSAGQPAGVVIANRAGRQAVKAKVIVDATHRAWVARLAGAEFLPYPAGPQRFTRIVVGGEPRTGPGAAARRIPLRYQIGGKPPLGYGTGTWARKRNLLMSEEVTELIEYTLTIPVRDGSWVSFAQADQIARDRTFHPEQLHDSEELFQIPPDPVIGEETLRGAWPGAAKADCDWFRPRALPRFYVLGGCAAVPRLAAATLLRPLEYMALGRRIGRAAAAQAATTPDLTAVRLPAVAGVPGTPVPGDSHEFLTGLRGTGQTGTSIPAGQRTLPVIARYDVVVVGGGTAGAPAGIGAARQGARTLVVECLAGLGGVSTTGLIGIYCAGYREGFTAATEAGISEIGAASYIVGKMEYWRREARAAGGHIWFGALGAGAVVHDSRVTGVVVATPQGRGIVLAGTVVDGTGNADVAAAAGAECVHAGQAGLEMQGAGLPRWETGATYINTDWTFVDDSDMLDVWSAFVVARAVNRNAYDLGQLIDTRERRRIVGDHVLSPLDIVNKRSFPDTVGIANGGKLDKHGATLHPYFMICNWRGGITYTPYRCMLPKGLDGILVTGLGLSAHTDAIPSIRMQPCMQNLGYAAGRAAAMAAELNGRTRDIDIKALQKQLVREKCLSPDVPHHRDSFPLPEATVQHAVSTLIQRGYSGFDVLLVDPGISIPMLREAYATPSSGRAGRLRCAHVLGMLGDATGVQTLIETVEEFRELDRDRIDTYFPWVTWLGSYMIALGRTRHPDALQPLLDKLALLQRTEDPAASHYRAVTLALDALGDPRAAPALARLLQSGRLGGEPITQLATPGKAKRDKGGRGKLLLAGTLYRLGDHEGLGRAVLTAFTQDLRGNYARYARVALRQGNAGK